jgi:hypothetical protein
MLTLIYSLDNREELVGFQVKGFKSFCLQDDVSAKLGQDFLSLVGLLERLMTIAAGAVFDARRKDAYGRARQIALEDRVELHDFPRIVAH